jgi:hypothetical protein
VKRSSKEVSGAGIASEDWDLAFPNNRTIWTNSGDTAAQKLSGGQGGVWHTNKTNFDDVTLAGKKEGVDDDGFDYTFLNTDLCRRVVSMDGVIQKNFNVMSFVGFDNEADAGVGLAEATPPTA